MDHTPEQRRELAPLDLSQHFVSLSASGGAQTHAVAGFWRDLMAGQLAAPGPWLMTFAESAASWGHWEMHPNGEEVVILLSGSVDFVSEVGGAEHCQQLRSSGEYVLVPRGTWHRAEIKQPSRLLFITAGDGTQHREAERADSGEPA